MNVQRNPDKLCISNPGYIVYGWEEVVSLLGRGTWEVTGGPHAFCSVGDNMCSPGCWDCNQWNNNTTMPPTFHMQWSMLLQGDTMQVCLWWVVYYEHVVCSIPSLIGWLIQSYVATGVLYIHDLHWNFAIIIRFGINCWEAMHAMPSITPKLF
jgi:hypothetical protein